MAVGVVPGSDTLVVVSIAGVVSGEDLPVVVVVVADSGVVSCNNNSSVLVSVVGVVSGHEEGSLGSLGSRETVTSCRLLMV